MEENKYPTPFPGWQDNKDHAKFCAEFDYADRKPKQLSVKASDHCVFVSFQPHIEDSWTCGTYSTPITYHQPKDIFKKELRDTFYNYCTFAQKMIDKEGGANHDGA